ncbi:flagellar basal-body MS-ring/collar protein FliF [Sessilibacter sp. MAH1]
MAETTSASMNSSPASNNLLEGFNNLNLIRQAGLMVGLAASVAIGFAVVLWTQKEDFRPLYGSLDRLDSAEVVEILEYNDIRFKVDPNTSALLVAADDVHKARLKLAEAGIPGEASVGFELLDQEQPLGTSQFMEGARYKRSLEGELAKTITSINSVRAARVHLAIPKESVFVRNARKPTASVFLELFPGRGLKHEQVKAIANLVASSIPELQLDDVTVVDQKGNLLTTGEEMAELVEAARQREYTRELENDLIARVNGILNPLVGSGNYRAEISADVDFTEIEQADEIYNPDLGAVRSEQTLDEQRVGSEIIAGIPGALSNQPPGDAQAPEQANPQDPTQQTPPSNTRKQATRNFELDRTISYTRHQLGKVKRLTVAVVVDDKNIVNAETGEVQSQPWTQEELERLTILVRDSIGFSAVRGDSVNVINSPFSGIRDEVSYELPIWEQPWFLGIAKQVVGLLIILALLLGLLRPVLKSLAGSGLKAKQEEEARELAALEASGLEAFDALSDETVTLTGGDALALPSPDENFEQQLNAIRGIIAEDAGRVALVIKGWINEDG